MMFFILSQYFSPCGKSRQYYFGLLRVTISTVAYPTLLSIAIIVEKLTFSTADEMNTSRSICLRKTWLNNREFWKGDLFTISKILFCVQWALYVQYKVVWKAFAISRCFMKSKCLLGTKSWFNQNNLRLNQLLSVIFRVDFDGYHDIRFWAWRQKSPPATDSGHLRSKRSWI